jgi:RNA polymerase sigma-70 factor, ECF subfamily
VEDDGVLLERMRAGDGRAFESLVTAHDGSLRRVARSFVQTAAAADEVVQETWLGVVRGLAGFEGRSSLRTWIFRILANTARTRAAQDARTLPFSSLEGDDRPAVEPSLFGSDGGWVAAPARLEGDPEGALLASELRERLMAVIDELPHAQRAVITLRDVVGMPADEVCEVLDIEDGNQRVLLHRARTQVRTDLKPLLEVRA